MISDLKSPAALPDNH